MSLNPKIVKILNDFPDTMIALRLPNEPLEKSNPMLGDALNSAIQEAATLPAAATGSTFAGVVDMADATSTFSVVFPAPLASANYSLAISISNLVDVTVRHLDPTIIAKSESGFTFHTAQTTDHPNYKVNYIAVMI